MSNGDAQSSLGNSLITRSTDELLRSSLSCTSKPSNTTRSSKAAPTSQKSVFSPGMMTVSSGFRAASRSMSCRTVMALRVAVLAAEGMCDGFYAITGCAVYMDPGGANCRAVIAELSRAGGANVQKDRAGWLSVAAADVIVRRADWIVRIG